jgi:hypothetical protein
MKIRKRGFAALTASAGLLLLAFASDAIQSEAAQSSLGDDPNGSLLVASKAIADFCGHVEGNDKDKLKAGADACNTYSTAMKSMSDSVATTLSKTYERARTKSLDAKSDAAQANWGQFWQTVLWAVDGIALFGGILVVAFSCIGADKIGLVREPPSALGVKGKISYSRVIGLVGGLGSLLFVGFITNVCLSHLFATGRMPDQLGTTYAAGVGTFLSALVPYIINQLNKGSGVPISSPAAGTPG